VPTVADGLAEGVEYVRLRLLTWPSTGEESVFGAVVDQS
jgi:hypothetical protein